MDGIVRRTRLQGLAVRFGTACIVLLWSLTPSLADANGEDRVLAERGNEETRSATASGSRAGRLNANDSVRDLLAHAAFAGFARRSCPITATWTLEPW